MIFKKIPILLVAALAPPPLFATDIVVTPDKPLEVSEYITSEDDQYLNVGFDVSVENSNETTVSTITRSDKTNKDLVMNGVLSLNQGVLVINNESPDDLIIRSYFQLGSESSAATIKTNGDVSFSQFKGTIVNTNLHIVTTSVIFYSNSSALTNFSTIKVDSEARLTLGTNGVYSTANLLIERSAGASYSSLTGNNSSQAGFISDSTLSNLNIEHAAITHKSHLTLDNAVLTNSTLTANNLTLVQRDVDASQTLNIDTVASISGDLTLNVYLADIDSLGVDFSFSADGITGLTDSNLAINFYDSLTNELYATGTDFTLNSGVYTSSVEFIPEPSTASLSLLALAGLLARRRRKAA